MSLHISMMYKYNHPTLNFFKICIQSKYIHTVYVIHTVKPIKLVSWIRKLDKIRLNQKQEQRNVGWICKYMVFLIRY